MFVIQQMSPIRPKLRVWAKEKLVPISSSCPKNLAPELCHLRCHMGWVIPSSHLLLMVTSERFLPAGDTFRVILASESHWLQPMLVLSVHWWPGTPASVRFDESERSYRTRFLEFGPTLNLAPSIMSKEVVEAITWSGIFRIKNCLF